MIFSGNVFSPLIYYSHLVPIILSLGIGILILVSNKKSLLNRLLFIITFLFSLWAYFDLITWATDIPSYTMFFWSLLILLEPIIYATSLYFLYVFVTKKDTSFKFKLVNFLILLPTILLLPTSYALTGFDFTNCDREAIEGGLVYYGYIIEVVYVLWIFIYGFGISRKKTKNEAKQIRLITIGLVLFLFSLAFGNVVGSLNVDWTIGQYGLFGLPIFAGFIAYLITKYKTLSTKVFTAQITSFFSIVAIFALLFVQNLNLIHLIVIPTIAVLLVLSYVLVKSVRREIQQKERLQELSVELERTNTTLADANERLKGLDKLKTEFLSLASHQLRSPLTAIKGYASMLDEGAFDKLNEKQDGAVKRIYSSAQGLVNLVEDLLNVSKIEQGGMKFQFMPTDIRQAVLDLAGEMKIPAENKKLELRVNVPEYDTFMANADPTKIKQVFLNLVDNSIKYTPSGYVEVGLKRNEKNDIVFYVKDTGVGVTPETKAKLFQKFSRGEGGKLNTGGSGLGLYLAQEIAKAHKGEIIIESEGTNKGATFSVVIPAVTSDSLKNTTLTS